MNTEKIIASIKDESIAFEPKRKERELTPLELEQVRKCKDGYFKIAVETNGKIRTATVPRDTVDRLIKDGTSLRVLKDRCNTLSALGYDFDKPLMYYAIVAYDLIPKEETEKWTSSKPLLEYELIHLNGDIDDIRQENVKLALKDQKVWDKIKAEYKKQNKVGADKEYTKIREEFLRNRFTEHPKLKVMTRVTDVVKKVKGGSLQVNNKHNEELLETIS